MKETQMKTAQLQLRYGPLLACGLAALFVSLAGNNAFASPPTNTQSVKIVYNSLDLTTQKGTQRLYRRIKNAARNVCTDLGEPWDVARSQHYWECYDTAVAKAVADVHSSNLTALHQEQDNKRKATG
jgi:UrcA family protein